jgi:isochorismate pyruvate lyase
MPEHDSLDEVRRHIDRLDQDIVALLAERARFVSAAATFKTSEAAVVVPERVEAIIAKVRAQALTHDADPGLMEAIYRGMIAQFIAYEQGEWRKKNA